MAQNHLEQHGAHVDEASKKVANTLNNPGPENPGGPASSSGSTALAAADAPVAPPRLKHKLLGAPKPTYQKNDTRVEDRFGQGLPPRSTAVVDSQGVVQGALSAGWPFMGDKRFGRTEFHDNRAPTVHTPETREALARNPAGQTVHVGPARPVPSVTNEIAGSYTNFGMSQGAPWYPENSGVSDMGIPLMTNPQAPDIPPDSRVQAYGDIRYR